MDKKNNMESGLEKLHHYHNLIKLFEDSQDCIGVMDEARNFIGCNKKMLTYFKCSNHVELSQQLLAYFEDEERNGEDTRLRFEYGLSQVFTTGSFSTHWIYLNPFLETSFLHVTMVKVEISTEPIALIFIDDMSEFVSGKAEEKRFSERFKAIIDATPLCLNFYNRSGMNLLCNKQAPLLFGLDNEDEYLDHFFDLSPKYQPNGRLSSECSKELINEVFETGHKRFNWLHCRLNGEEIPCEITLTKISLFEDEYVVGFTRDLSQELASSESENTYENYFLNKIADKTLLRSIADMSDEWFFALDRRTRMVQYYGKSITSEGQQFGEIAVLGTQLENNIIHPGDFDIYKEMMESMLSGGSNQYCLRYRQKDKSYRFFNVTYRPIIQADGSCNFVVGKATDVHEKVILEERSKKDLMTDCYNKISGEYIAEERITKMSEREHTLFVIDVDNFKAINDNLGHFMGDEVLKELAAGLKKVFRNNDVISRIGGDEFTVFMENTAQRSVLEHRANKIVETFHRSYKGAGKDYCVSASVGIATYPVDGTTYEELYQAADKALYQAKLNGKNGFMFYKNDFIDGTMQGLTRLENAARIAGSYFDYDLIASVFEILYERSGDDFSINAALRFVGQKYNADRCYIFESFDEGETYDNTYEWVNEGISVEIDNLQGQSKDLFEDLFNTASNQGIVYTNDLSSIFNTNDAFEMMAKQGIKSFVHAQVRRDGVVKFMLGLDDCTKERVWSEKEINSLQYISKMVSIILQGNNLKKEKDSLAKANQLSADISDSADELVYVSDPYSHELLHMNRALLNALGNPPESDWKGAKCYKILQGKNSVCEFCTNKYLSEDKFHIWQYDNHMMNKTFMCKDKFIKLNNRIARLEIAFDITKLVQLEHELKEELEQGDVLISCIGTLHSGDTPEISINNLLEIIANFHCADRSYIFELDSHQKFSNTFEWCKVGVEAVIGNLKGLSPDMFQDWMYRFESEGEFYIDDVESVYDRDGEFCISFQMQGINSLFAAPIRDINGKVTGFIGVDNPRENVHKRALLRSVSRFIASFLDSSELLSNLNQLSYYDTLTGAKNRNSYRDCVQFINQVEIESLGIAYIDIKGLSNINDAYGQEFGDGVVRRLANILMSLFDDDVYRVDGDEFIVIALNISEKTFESKIKKLSAMINDEAFKASLGFTWNRGLNQNDVAQLQQNGSKYKKILATNLNKEISDNKFIVYLQPQIDLKTGNIVSAEALVRRLGADGKVQVPISFIPFYEKEGIISQIDCFVFENVCQVLEKWKKQYRVDDFKVSVNFSRITVMDKQIVERLCQIIDKYQVKKSSIIIEITETISGTSDKLLADIVANFTLAGFEVSLDDFGSGYSNLSSLMLANFHEIKLDMSLVNNLHQDHKSKVLVGMALNMCKELQGVVSVAEGVEYEHQARLLNEMGCVKGQGYYFDKPQPIEIFEEKYIRE